MASTWKSGAVAAALAGFVVLGCGEAPRPKPQKAAKERPAGDEIVQSFPVKHETNLALGMESRPRLFTLDSTLDERAVARVRYIRERWRPLQKERSFAFRNAQKGDVYLIYSMVPNPSTGEPQPYEKNTIDMFLYKDGSSDIKLLPDIVPEMVTENPKTGEVVERSEKAYRERMYRVYPDGSAAVRSTRKEVEPTKRTDNPDFDVAPWHPLFLVRTCAAFCAANPSAGTVEDPGETPSSIELERKHPTDPAIVFEERVLVEEWRDAAGFKVPDGLYREVKDNFAQRELTTTDVFTLVEVELAPEMR